MDLKLEHRTHCPVCHHNDLKPFKKIDSFPVLPICTESDKNKDLFAPIDLVICQECGCLQLGTLVAREIIYSSAHSEGIGATWANHYLEFEKFVRRNSPLNKQLKVLEVGAGQGQVANQLAQDCKLSIIEPNYGGSTEHIEVLNGFFIKDEMRKYENAYEMIYSSHTLEHFFDFREYFETAQFTLKKNGLLLTAVPNLESALQAGYANALNFEHTAMLTLPHILRLHGDFGFRVKNIYYYKDHGIYFAAEKVDTAEKLKINTEQYMVYLFDKFYNTILTQKKKIEAHLKSSVPSYLFGASQLSQFLFSLGLDSKSFNGLLDNAKNKNQKRLYGTELISHIPDQVVSELKGAQVFVNGGPYTQEIYDQLYKLVSNKTELIRL